MAGEIGTLLGVMLLALVTYRLCRLVHDVWLHPLARIPGPGARAASRLPLAWSIVRGAMAHDAERLHRAHGPVVRIASGEVSVAGEACWHELLHGRDERFLKDPVWWGEQPGLPPSVVTAVAPEHHRRHRRLIGPSLAAEAVRAQEGTMRAYADLLVHRLRGLANDHHDGEGVTVDLVPWLHFFAFDLFGALFFRRSFDGLRDARYHPWIALLFASIKAAALVAAARLFPLGGFLLLRCIPPALRRTQRDHYDHIAGRVRDRFADKRPAPDLMDPLLARADRHALPDDELYSTFMILTVAGSETVATALSGTMLYLVRDPPKLARLTADIRAAFPALEDICLDRLGALPYLDAVVQEGLRLCPPIPTILPRRVPKGGATICGAWLPEGTAVSIPVYAMNRDPDFFRDAASFVPERWLPHTGPETSPYASDQRHAMQSFGYGPRRCPGQALALAEMRLVLGKLLWAFDFEAESPVDWVDQRVFVLWEKRPIEVTLRART